MTLLICFALVFPIGFICGAIGMALWLVFKFLAVTGAKAGIRWVKAAVDGGL